MPRTHHSFRPMRQTLAIWCCIGLLLNGMSPAWSAPSQSPLITRPEKRPLPNFMLTLDDSGSMTYQYLPERSFTLKNGTVTETVAFPNDGKVFLHPSELRTNIFSGRSDGEDVHFVAADVSSGPADAGTLLHQMQMRSPQVNSIYYNPAKRYRPWKDDKGHDFSQASIANAYLNPMALAPNSTTAPTTAAVDLTDTVTPYKARWYCSTDAGAPNYTPCGVSSKPFNPAIVYLLNPNQSANEVLPTNYKLYNLNDPNASSFTYNQKYADRTDCVVTQTSTVCSKDVERQNFANWFVFYRSRLLIAQGAIPAAFADISDSIRLGWATIHSGDFSADADAGSTSKESFVQQGVRSFTADHKLKFFDWIRSRPTFAGTPSRSALIGVGDYFQRTDEQNPWSSKPELRTSSYNPANDLTCRRSFNILVTDGYYRAETISVGNVDGNNLTPNYAKAAPFADEESNTLADIAMKYWATDLRDIDNNVPPLTNAKAYKSDPATWQHLNQFMIGLGVTGTMPTTDAQLELLANCTSTNGCWKPTGTYDLIDDLWHAAINSRGQYFSATDSASLTTALESALEIGRGAIQKEAGVATAAPTLINGNVKFIPEYTPIKWTGNIRAYALDASGVASPVESWNAVGSLPAPESRNIFIWDAGATIPQAIPFKPSVTNNQRNLDAFSAPLIAKMGAQASPNLVDYLRGGNPADNVPRRVRESPLADFVNSTPLFVKNGFDLGYTSLSQDAGNTSRAGAGTYKAYLDTKAGRNNGALFIGGNGGMLHTFSSDGIERFAFVPYAGAGNLYKLARRDYGSEANFHQFFVDGPLVESDAYIGSGTTKEWTNVVLGTMGAGGRSIFALKLNSDNPSQLDASSVMWELDGPSDEVATGSARDDIGYITSEVQVGMLPNGRWKAFVGNGLDSQSGRAALLVIDLQDGTLESIVADSSAGNGLGGVRLARNGTSKEVLAVYAGDAKGQLWRFDYVPPTESPDGAASAASAASSTDDTAGSRMVVGFKGKPLFTARDPLLVAQPITAAPVLRPHPNGGRLLVFGTGRLFSDADSDTTQTQTIYGIWDEVKELDTSGAAPSPVLSSGIDARAPASLLVKQEINKVTTVTQLDADGKPLPELGADRLPLKDSSGNIIYQTSTFYGLTSNSVDWGQKKGWLLDLIMPTTSTTSDHPRVIYTPDLFGQSVYVTALTPAQNKESCSASTTTNGYGFLLKFFTGAQQIQASFDTNGNGVLDKTDISAAGVRVPAGPQTIMTRQSPLDFETGAGATPGCVAGSAQGAYGSRGIQDCEAAKVTDRIWRQLLNPPAP
ncbi:pilus assembly protein [Aquabacterium sp.]|uniref:pilus assembly protein n=1 Tax=Aquabacterium sp. TaxID=1872578 RepID=UPI003D6DA33B